MRRSARRLIREHGVRHIIGCVTSWSRKEVIPVLEKSGATLWYACPYEGFEANEHVVYMHACPNQHLVPLLGYVVPRFGANGLLLGSNYIWGWETNRVARDLIADAGGSVLAERYLPIGETDVSRLIGEVRATRPDFILNNLIGTSSYAFIAAYAELGLRDPHFRPDRCPLLSCNLTECELPAIGNAAKGHLSAGPYFRAPADIGKLLRETLLQAGIVIRSCGLCLRARFGQGVWPVTPTPPSRSFPFVFARATFETPFGDTIIDPQTQHATLPVVIGRIADDGFETVSRTEGVAPDPYLSRYDRAEIFGRPRLKVVS